MVARHQRSEAQGLGKDRTAPQHISTRQAQSSFSLSSFGDASKSIGLLLLMNFLISTVQLEMEASRDFSEHEQTFASVNQAFTVIYTMELAVIMLGHCPDRAGQWPYCGGPFSPRAGKTLDLSVRVDCQSECAGH